MESTVSRERLNEAIADASKAIFGYCRARTPNRMEAEDLCQDILCELIRSSENIRDSKAFYGFMWAVAGNVYKQWCRKKAKMQVCELTEDIPAQGSVLDKVLADEGNSDLYLLRRELTLLSEKYRQAVILYYIEGKSCSEISQMLSISESKVKYLLFKSRIILKEGMSMERRLGELSYHPKNFVPMFSGQGVNFFWDFMQSKIRQNIVAACYNDAMTPERISLETGIPLSYIESEISALTEKEILVKEGPRYKANVIIITEECSDEISRSSAPCHGKIADLLAEFLEEGLPAFRQIGFSENSFTDHTMRWQLLTFVLREIRGFDVQGDKGEPPLTAWGNKAYLYLKEQGEALNKYSLFSYCTLSSRRGDWVQFMDYRPDPKSDHHDFFGNDYLVDILCDIAHGDWGKFSEYDLEAAAELIRKGYVRKENDTYTVAMPLFTQEQYAAVCRLAGEFVREKLGDTIMELDGISTRILREHTPRHLQDKVPGISSVDEFTSAGCIPVSILLDRKILNTNWNPLEIPTMQIRLNR